MIRQYVAFCYVTLLLYITLRDVTLYCIVLYYTISYYARLCYHTVIYHNIILYIYGMSCYCSVTLLYIAFLDCIILHCIASYPIISYYIITYTYAFRSHVSDVLLSLWCPLYSVVLFVIFLPIWSSEKNSFLLFSNISSAMLFAHRFCACFSWTVVSSIYQNNRSKASV